jgi:hypothetical protein
MEDEIISISSSIRVGGVCYRNTSSIGSTVVRVQSICRPCGDAMEDVVRPVLLAQ